MTDKIDGDLQHIADFRRAPTEKKHATSLKHLQRFITLHHAQFTPIGITEQTNASELTYEQVNNEDFWGFFLDYLARFAKYLDGQDKLLAHSSVAGYASSTAEYYINLYRDR